MRGDKTLTKLFIMGPCSAESVENYFSSYEYLMPIMEGSDT